MPRRQALLDLPFDHIFFTGSPAVGKIVMAFSAKHLTSPVTLELGGKSPTIVDETADLKAAAQNILLGQVHQQWPTCIAPDHIYVHSSVKEEFLRHCIAALEGAYGKAAQQATAPAWRGSVNPPIPRGQGAAGDATQRGARVATRRLLVDEAQRYIAPTLLDGFRPLRQHPGTKKSSGRCCPSSAIAQLGYGDCPINAETKPLALYVWSRTQKSISKVM